MKKFLILILYSISIYGQTGGYSLTFDGTNDCVSLPATLWNNNFSNGTTITVEFWFKGTLINSVYRIQTAINYFVAGYYGGDHIISTDGGTDGVSIGSKLTIENGAWHHLAVTWSKNGFFTSYLDGAQVEQKPAANVNLPVMDIANFLASYGGGSEFLTGALDEVRIWNVVRTAPEISHYKDYELIGNESGLVAYYKMSNGTGTTLTDNAAGTYPGTLLNGVIWSTDAAPVRAPFLNYALSFDGNDYVTLPATLWNNNFSNGTAITVEFWFKGTHINSVYRIQTSDVNYFVAGYYGGYHIISTDGGTNGVSIGNKLTIENGAWHHLAVTWSKNGFFTSYLDGVQAGQRAAADVNLPLMDIANFLASYGGTSEFLTGALDEVRIWNVVRTAPEISYYKDYELIGNESGLVAYYKMSNGTGTTLSDNKTGGSSAGTITGAGWVEGAPVTEYVLPVELITFTASVSKNKITLYWQTATEVNNYGFFVEKSENGNQKSEWKTIGFVEGNGNCNSTKEYSFIDNGLLSGTIKYRLKQVDTDGSYTYSKEIEVKIESAPREFALLQNYPNPFNPSTKINYSIPQNSRVTMRIYDVLGKEMLTLVDEEKQIGSYVIEFDGSNLASGIYFYQIKSGNFIQTKKLILMK